MASSEKAKAASREWYYRQPEEKRLDIQRRNRARRQRIKASSEGRKFWAVDAKNNAKFRAQKSGIPFDLVASDLPTPDVCPVLGIRLIYGGGRLQSASPSVDRLQPNRGYIRGNIATISHRANTLKNNSTDPNELYAVAVYVAEQIPLLRLIEIAEQF